MARTALSAQTPGGTAPSLPYGATAANFTWAAADNANGNKVTSTGQEMILVRNDDVGAQTITISSVAAGRLKRKGDITTYSIGAGLYAFFGPFGVEGWRQTDGNIYIDTSSANIHLAVVRLPSGG